MVDILMATYNGEQFIRQQLDSIFQQSYQEWQLIIRDDCSKDKTVEIIKEYQLLHPGRITLIPANQPSGSAQKNFFLLLPYSTAPYMMFADQDDVWLPDKIQLTIEKMQQIETDFDSTMPILVHTDLAITDTDLNVLNPSRYDMHDINPERNKLNHLLVQGIVYGCTLMVNRALLNLITERPKLDVMHDTWLSLLACTFGQIGYVDKPLVQYRRHGGNSTGLCTKGRLQWFFYQLANIKKIHNKHEAYYMQAGELLAIYNEQLTIGQKDILRSYANLSKAFLLKKVFVLGKFDLYRNGFLPKIAQILL